MMAYSKKYYWTPAGRYGSTRQKWDQETLATSYTTTKPSTERILGLAYNGETVRKIINTDSKHRSRSIGTRIHIGRSRKTYLRILVHDQHRNIETDHVQNSKVQSAQDKGDQ